MAYKTISIVIIATEASGDFLGSELMKTFRNVRGVKIFGVGGNKMIAEGLKSWVKISNFNAIGIYEVITKIFKFANLLKLIENNIRVLNPDIVITIDSPSFNYRLIEKIQDIRSNTKFIHYVAPTVWAWKSYRAKIFSKFYDRIFTLFNFEPKYFKRYGLQSDFVGHQIFFDKLKILKKNKIITFLPGSRTSEIINNMKKLKYIIEKSIYKFKDFEIFILTFKENKDLIEYFIKNKSIKVIWNQKEKENIMRRTFLAVAASGSVTLELIKYQSPIIVFYDTHWITKIFIKLMVNVKFASIINIFYDKEIIPEYLFNRFNLKNVMKEMDQLIYNNKLREKQIRYFRDFSGKMLIDKKNPSDLILKKLDL